MIKLVLLTLSRLKHCSSRHTVVVELVTKHCHLNRLSLDIHTATGMHSVSGICMYIMLCLANVSAFLFNGR